jgi:hypothetical protein
MRKSLTLFAGLLLSTEVVFAGPKPRRRRYVGVIVPLKIKTDSNRAVTPLFPNAENQGNNLRWNVKLDMVWSSGQVPETR